MEEQDLCDLPDEAKKPVNTPPQDQELVIEQDGIMAVRRLLVKELMPIVRQYRITEVECVPVACLVMVEAVKECIVAILKLSQSVNIQVGRKVCIQEE